MCHYNHARGRNYVEAIGWLRRPSSVAPSHRPPAIAMALRDLIRMSCGIMNKLQNDSVAHWYGTLNYKWRPQSIRDRFSVYLARASET